MKEGSGDRYFQNETKIRARGRGRELTKDLANVQLNGGIRSGMGYCGAKDLKKLNENAEFVRITNAGLTESHPHDLSAMKHEANY